MFSAYFCHEHIQSKAFPHAPSLANHFIHPRSQLSPVLNSYPTLARSDYLARGCTHNRGPRDGRIGPLVASAPPRPDPVVGHAGHAVYRGTRPSGYQDPVTVCPRGARMHEETQKAILRHKPRVTASLAPLCRSPTAEELVERSFIVRVQVWSRGYPSLRCRRVLPCPHPPFTSL